MTKIKYQIHQPFVAGKCLVIPLNFFLYQLAQQKDVIVAPKLSTSNKYQIVASMLNGMFMLSGNSLNMFWGKV